MHLGYISGTARGSSHSGRGPKIVLVSGRPPSPIPVTSSTWDKNRCRCPPIFVSSTELTNTMKSSPFAACR